MMPRQNRHRHAATRALLAAAALAHLAAASPLSGTLIEPSTPSSGLQPSSSSSMHSSLSHSSGHGPVMYSAPGASGALLERIGSYLSSLLPESGMWDGDADDDSEGSGSSGSGGLFGDGSASLAWGGSTLEVEKTQASYLTRPAAFGPRIHSDDGLRGVLLPISDFYRGNERGARSGARDADMPDNHGCPYKGGPGWRDTDFDDDPVLQMEMATHSRDNVSPQSLHSDKQSSLVDSDGAHAVKPPNDWIALVERGGGCAFAAKVRVAQALGAVAVVVGDAPSPEYEHDNPYRVDDPGLAGRLVTMFAPGDTSDIEVPSTFITRPSYIDLIRLIDEETQDAKDECAEKRKAGEVCDEDDEDAARKRGVRVVLWRDDVMWEWPLIDFAFILLLLPSFMTLITIVVHRVRMARQRRRERAPELAVLNLPCLIWRPNGQPWEKVEEAETLSVPPEPNHSHARRPAHESAANSGIAGTSASRQRDDVELAVQEEGNTEAGPSRSLPRNSPSAGGPASQEEARTYYSCDECAICLSEFVDGEKVRVLPCGHVFHLPEIDSWLLRVKKLCPICKRDITVPIPPSVPAPALAVLEPLSRSGIDDTASSPAEGHSSVPADDETATETSPMLRRESN